MPGSRTRRWRWRSIPALVRTDRLQSAAAAGTAEGVRGDPAPRRRAELGQLGVDLIVARTVDAIRKSVAAATLNAGDQESSWRNRCCGAALPPCFAPGPPSSLPGAGSGGVWGSRGAAASDRDRDRARHAAGGRTRPTSTARPPPASSSAAVAGGPAARVRPAREVERRLRHRSGDAQGRRQVQGRHQSAARRAVVGPAHAVGRQQCRRPHATAA